MNNQDIIIERTKALLETNLCKELADAANEWLNAIGTDSEKEAAKKYVFELEDAVMKIDAVIQFMSSDAAKEKFGEEMANAIAAHAREIKAQGAVYCDCPACTAGLKVLEYKTDLLG